MEEELLTRWEVAKLCSLSEYQLTKAVKSGELPAFKLGNVRGAHLRFKRSDVEAFLAKHLVPVR